jgi:hypothetical protein
MNETQINPEQGTKQLESFKEVWTNECEGNKYK